MNSTLYQTSAMRKRTPYLLFIRRYWRTLIGTAGTWFIYDFITVLLYLGSSQRSDTQLTLTGFVQFPNGVFSSVIISSVIPNPTLLKTMEWNLLLSVLSLPGLFIGAFIVNKIGRRNLLMVGFAGYLVVGLIIVRHSADSSLSLLSARVTSTQRGHHRVSDTTSSARLFRSLSCYTGS